MTGFEVNGAPVEVDGDPDTPLLTVLRDDLALVGTRFGCGQGLCGACFVRLDKDVVPSCQTPVWQAEGRSVTTVEGMSADGTPHPCSARSSTGRPPSAASASPGSSSAPPPCSTTEPTPTPTRVAAALDGNLCRCGAHRADHRRRPRRPDATGRAMTRPAAPRHHQPSARQLGGGRPDGRWWRSGWARPSSARASPPPSRSSPPTRSACRSTDPDAPPAHRRSAPTRGSPPAVCRCCRPGRALVHVGGVVRALAGPVAPIEHVRRPDRRARRRARPHDRRAARAPRPTVPSAAARRGSTCPTRSSAGRASSPTCDPTGLLHGRVLRPPSVGAGARRRSRDGWQAPGVTARARRLVPRRRRRARGRRRPGARRSSAATPPGTSGDLLPDDDDLSDGSRVRHARGRAGPRRGGRRRPRRPPSSRRRTRARSSPTPPSHPAPPWRSRTTPTASTSGPTARASTPCATRSPPRSTWIPRRSWSSTSRTPAATATTRPTTPPSTPCCWPGRCPDGPCCSVGPVPTS